MFLLTHTSGGREHWEGTRPKEKQSNGNKKRGEINCNSLVFNESQVGILMQYTFLVALTLSGILVGLVSKDCLRKDRQEKCCSSNGKGGLSRLRCCCFKKKKKKNGRCAQHPQRPVSELGRGGREKQMTRSRCDLSTLPRHFSRQGLACGNNPLYFSKAKRSCLTNLPTLHSPYKTSKHFIP